MCIIKPGTNAAVGVGSGNPQGGRAEIARAGFWRRIRSDKEVVACSYSIRVRDFHHQLKRPGRNVAAIGTLNMVTD